MTIFSKSVEETKKMAANLAKEIAKSGNENGKNAIVVALEGELGAGKTTFVQGFAKGFKIDDKITSPTFVIFKMYSIGKGKYFKKMVHVDCYRLKDHKDLLNIGFNDVVKDKDNIVLIEWSDRVEKILPQKHIKIHIDHINENERKIMIS